jgi:hypothetical protein
MALPLGRAYGVFAGNVAFQPGDYFLESSLDALTANAGGGQQNALQITSQTARITIVATAGDSIQLPPATPGLELLVINHGANPMQVFGNYAGGIDTIDDQAFGTGVSQMSNSMVIYSSPVNGKWYSEGLSSGFALSLGLQTFSNAQIASNATNTQASGTPVTTLLTNVTGAAAGSVTLPASVPGLELTVHNVSGFAVNVFPSAGGTGSEKINGGSANAALSLPAQTSTTFTCVLAGSWYTVPRTPS